MKVLVVGPGAREHALVRSLAADPGVTKLYAAPGNPGIAGLIGERNCLPVDTLDPQAVAALATDLEADLVVVGPEAPLVAGVSDAVRAAGVPCFGPSAAAAQLEGSKAFAKDVMAAAGVPTGASYACTTLEEVQKALTEFGAPYVVKDDGLAAGKGVVVTESVDAALAHAAACLDREGGRVVIEEFLDGPEVSLFCITDGKTVLPLAPAQDFKRALDGDLGPNTGGMGAYSPLPWAPADLVDDVVENVARPTIEEMARRGAPFVGVLYCGLALTSRGVKVIEFNARFGDPETQVVLARLSTPLGMLLRAAAVQHLEHVPPLEWLDRAAVTVVLASENYPDTPVKGDVITGVSDADGWPDAWVLHAGTAIEEGDLVAAGGRVLSVVATGEDLTAARTTVYAALERIGLRGGQFRKDIAEAAAAAELTERLAHPAVPSES
ncbi:phosphoribosylamine--glycine ligase [Kineosporia rhizophila]|uniref:phosphoribosylamine--glycine ligase n=1 Tax=Kineosporia TaxID=49184 RepID=UPI001E28CE30|nr:phosphoribosylamine--glycine ligase [Kineosporia sp. NBRC 101677]MCE0534255.1 phosphoribosylamine--glycine ligase [Kineosporia rhizophila]